MTQKPLLTPYSSFRPLNNQNGLSLMALVIGLALLSLLVQSNLISQALNLRKDWKDSTTFATKNSLVFSLAEDVANEIALQYSRYDSNSELEQCLKAQPAPCDERRDYDMALYAPVVQQSFQGGSWGRAPAGALLLAGGRNTNVTLFRSTGARCPHTQQTVADDFCP